MKQWYSVLALTAVLFAAFCAAACTNSLNEAEIDTRTLYSVRVNPQPQHGALSLSEQYARQGTWVTVYVNPQPGYKLTTGTAAQKQGIFFRANSPGLEPVSKYGGKYQFSCPSNNVEITASFERALYGEYTVSMDASMSGGVIMADTLCSTAGSVVYLTLIPEKGRVLKPGTLKLINADTQAETPIPETFPYQFTLPSHNVMVSAVFETVHDVNGLINNARAYVSTGQYDRAAALYETAWQKDNSNPEAILYSALGKLGAILLDADVRAILSGHLHFNTVPGSLDDWICDPDFWGEIINASDSNEIKNNKEQLKASQRWWMDWDPDPVKEANWPKIYSRFSGFVSPFGDFQIAQAQATRQKFYNLIFWGLVSSNTGGFNSFLKEVNRSIFGEKFEAAAARAALMPAAAGVELNSQLKKCFKLEKYFGSGTSSIGKAELDYLFACLRAVQALFEYLSAYDWSIDLRPWLTSEIRTDDGIDDILDKMFTLADSSLRDMKYWQDGATVQRILPFRNNFLKIRNASSLEIAHNRLRQAVNAADASMGYWFNSSGGFTTSRFSAEAQADYQWARQAVSAAKTALNGDGAYFYFPEKLPESQSGSRWPAASDTDAAYGMKVYAVNTAEFFTPGAFSLMNMVVSELGGRAPSLYNVEWHQSGDDVVLTGSTLVTEAITGADENELYSFAVNTANLKKIFPRGYEQFGDTGLLCSVFPHTPLWPDCPTYFKGGKSSAAHLYKYYHQR
jgi:hypothetical protein